MVGKAKQRDTEELLSGVCTLGLSGWLAGATGCRSPVVAAGELDQEACPNRGRLQARVRRLRHQRRQSPLLPVLPWSRMLPQHQRGPAPATRGKSTCEL